MFFTKLPMAAARYAAFASKRPLLPIAAMDSGPEESPPGSAPMLSDRL